MNTITRAVALAMGLGFAAGAQAGPIQNFIIKDGAGNVLSTGVPAQSQTLDWNEAGTGGGIGLAPFSQTQIPVGTVFQFVYQANLVGITGGDASNARVDSSNGAAGFGGSVGGLNGYEYTIVASFWEEVTFSGALPGGNSQAFFSPTTGPTPNKVSIFYDDGDAGTAAGGGVGANTLTGVGFDDGTEVLRMTIVGGAESDFRTTSPTTGQGSTKLNAELVTADDFVNANFLEGFEDFIFDIFFESNLNYPPGTSSTTNFHASGPVATNCLPGPAADCYPTRNVGAENILLFKVDGSSQFSRVPEPSTMLLLGGGLLGLGMMARRRKQTFA